MLQEKYPILEYDSDSATNAKEYFFRQGKKDFSKLKKVNEAGIDKCILFLPRHFNQLKQYHKKCKLVYEFKSASTISPVYLYDNKLLIALCPLGGPAVANLVEELEYNGIKKFISCGTCGLIDQSKDVDNFFVPTSAIRDEGLSYHYMAPSRDIKISTKFTKALCNALQYYGVNYYTGTVWTIDAIYRETPKRIKRRLKEGAIGVDMECASLAAVCKYNKCEFASLLYFSDSTDGIKWNWRFYDKIALRSLLLDICIKAFESL